MQDFMRGGTFRLPYDIIGNPVSNKNVAVVGQKGRLRIADMLRDGNNGIDYRSVGSIHGSFKGSRVEIEAGMADNHQMGECQ